MYTITNNFLVVNKTFFSFVYERFPISKQMSFRIFWSKGSNSGRVREDIRGQLPGTLLPDLPVA